jgi:hypothetical protein
MVQSGAPATREPSPISFGWCPIVGKCLQSSPNLIEAQTHLLGNADEGNAAYDFAWVSALPAIRSIGANQALFLVVPQRGNGDTSAFSYLSYRDPVHTETIA